MTFPKKILGIRIGWKDLGEDKRFAGTYKLEHPYTILGYPVTHENMHYVHEFCGNKLRIGEEKEELFYYCPNCTRKIKG